MAFKLYVLMSYMFCRYLPHTMSTYIHALMQSHRLPPTKSVICNHSAILSILLENMTLASTKLSLTSNYLNLASNLASFSRVPKELYEALVGKPRCGCALCTNKVFSQSMCQHRHSACKSMFFHPSIFLQVWDLALDLHLLSPSFTGSKNILTSFRRTEYSEREREKEIRREKQWMRVF